jgi:hypothetical protein
MKDRILGSAVAGALVLGLVGLAAGSAGATQPQTEQGGQPGAHVPNVAPKQQLDAIQRQLRQKQLRQTAPEAAEANSEAREQSQRTD